MSASSPATTAAPGRKASSRRRMASSPWCASSAPIRPRPSTSRAEPRSPHPNTQLPRGSEDYMTDIPISSDARLDGRVAFVTGGTGGIGRAVCASLAAAGARVVAADLQEGSAVSEPTPGVDFLCCDVTSRAGTEAVIDQVLARHGRIDVLVLCAGTIARTPLQDSEDAEWQAMLDVNLMGVVNPLRKLYPIMVQAGGGKIVAL